MTEPEPETEHETETETESDLTPGRRRLTPGPAGTVVTLGGHDWVLADAPPELSAVWDRLYDQNVLRHWYDPDDLRLAAVGLLWAHYRLSADEAVALVRSVPPAALVAAVEAALLGTGRGYRGFGDWVRSSLLANGLDPAKVPARDLHNVLRQLVALGRAEPRHSFVSSAEAAGKRRAILDPAGG